MFKEAIILAGGFGTRLSHVVSDVPKPMAPVYGKPFLTYLIDRLIEAGIRRVILATGYKHEYIESYFGSSYRGIEIVYSQETTPLFTGGAILQAAKYVTGDYVRNWSMWEWLPGVLDAMPLLAKRYRRIFIVTNQQGVGKGLMSEADLEDVHLHMLADIEAAGGRIDKIYVCTELESSFSPNRKPEIGMALQAKIDFPEVDFHRSVMVGDSKSDELFAQRSRMRFAESIPALGL